ncbi:MAG: hypothetical protein QXU95_04270 [Candidatus Bathyarchaeia archaeon]
MTSLKPTLIIERPRSIMEEITNAKAVERGFILSLTPNQRIPISN